MKLSISALFAMSALLGACQLQPDVQQIKDQNVQLTHDLSHAQDSIAELQTQEWKLQQDIAELNRVNSVLDTEKSSRIQESSELRSQVRRFVLSQIDAYKNFLVQGGLLDYVGSELVERTSIEEQPLFLVDLANPIPSPGTLTGVGAHVVKPGSFNVKVLRPVEGQLVAIWESNSLPVLQTGINRINFLVSVVVEKGDVIAYHLQQGVAVSFDEGTGDTRFLNDALKLGKTISSSSLDGEGRRRAYSLGVFGLLN